MRTRSVDTPKPPYTTIIFTCTVKEFSEEYLSERKRMYDLIVKTKGFIGSESFLNQKGFGVTTYYFKDPKNIKIWDDLNAHINQIDEKGKSKWYHHYSVRIGKIERDFRFDDE